MFTSVWSCLLVICLIFWLCKMIDREIFLMQILMKSCHPHVLLLARSDCLYFSDSLFLPLLNWCNVCLFNRRSPVVMWAVPAARGWLPLPSGRGGRPPPSLAPVIPRHPLRLRARGSAGIFPPTAPGQPLVFVSLIISISEWQKLCMLLCSTMID